jgi:hypothetical protein
MDTTKTGRPSSDSAKAEPTEVATSPRCGVARRGRSADGGAAVVSVVELLTVFRKQAETEAGVPCHEIDTTLGLALLDICVALALDDDQTRVVLGEAAYRAICDEAIPLTVHEEVCRVQQEEVS